MMHNIDKIICTLVRALRTTENFPHFLEKRSRKKYGWRDDIARYWWENYFNIKVGKYSYGYQTLNRGLLCSVGAFSSIAVGVELVPNTHRMDFCTTSPILSHKDFGFIDNDYINVYASNFEKSIKIGNDVWIGANAIIFNNVTIGDGAVIAAGSIIRKDVPPYAVVGGVDRIIKYRFSKENIDKLLKIKWWDWDDEEIKKNISFMYNVDEFIASFYNEGVHLN